MIEDIHIESVDRLSRELHAMGHGEWVYRGQSDASWPLESSFFRFANRVTRLRYGAQPLTGRAKLSWYRMLRKLEHNAFAEFRDHVAPRIAGQTPSTMLSALSDMQHYGCPTRLLDFTCLPYVALFFALEQGDSDCSLFAVRLSQLQSLEDSKGGGSRLWAEEGAEKPAVYIFTPPYTTERIAKQKGAFLVPSTTILPFQDIADSAGLHIIRFVLPARLRAESVALLAKMNIAPASVYPETEGQVRSLAWDIQAKVLSCPL